MKSRAACLLAMMIGAAAGPESSAAVPTDHYSPLRQINRSTVAELGFAWEYPVTFRGRVPHRLEATPIVVDGVMYASGPWGTTYAVDAKTGREVWRYDPDVDGSWARRTCCGVVNRGVAVGEGRVYVGTVDGYLAALDARNGSVIWKKDTLVNRSASYSIVSAPIVADGRVVIGNSGADMDARGYITAYDEKTGALAWRFYTVPGDPARGVEHPELAAAAKTWSPRSDWSLGGGGAAWGAMAFDPESHLLYVGTANGVSWPVWKRSPGGGDNLYLSSVLAIRPDTGRLAWHYQTTPGDSWDYDATQNFVLTELRLAGKTRKVLMQAPKNGFFYVLDRLTGELLSAKNFVPVNWATGVDLRSGRPLMRKQADYDEHPRVVMPGPKGAHNWPPMSFSPRTGLTYIPALEEATLFADDETFKAAPQSWNLGTEFHYGPPYPAAKAGVAKDGEYPAPARKLKAWDPVQQREAWSAVGSISGVLSTAGDVVIQGTPAGQLIVHDAKTGRRLKSIDTGTSIEAAPMSFVADGQQYIAVMASGAGSVPREPGATPRYYRNTPRILAFRLGGGATPLPPVADPVALSEPPPLHATPAELERGKALFARYCVRCHRGGVEDTPTVYPDLTMMPAAVHPIFEDIVLGGALSAGGMASFADVLTAQDARAVHAYLIDLSWQRFNAQRSTKFPARQ